MSEVRPTPLSPPPPVDTSFGLPQPRRTAAIASVLAALVVLDAAIANVALPTIALAIGAMLTLVAGLVSTLRARQTAASTFVEM